MHVFQALGSLLFVSNRSLSYSRPQVEVSPRISISAQGETSRAPCNKQQTNQRVNNKNTPLFPPPPPLPGPVTTPRASKRSSSRRRHDIFRRYLSDLEELHSMLRGLAPAVIMVQAMSATFTGCWGHKTHTNKERKKRQERGGRVTFRCSPVYTTYFVHIQNRAGLNPKIT